MGRSKPKRAARRERRNGNGGQRRSPVRYAVVGLGYIAQVAVLPAFAHAKNSRLAALVSDDPVKLKKLGAKYEVERRCSYEEYDELLESGEIDAVFIALPNSLHADYAIRAARAGVHVLCEKPLAVSAEECRQMIAAAEQNDVRLMTAYRLHFERANLTAVEIVSSGKLGEPRLFTSDFTMQVRDKDNIRLDRALGGGTLFDIGIYCINAARYLFQSEPFEAFGWTVRGTDGRFHDVEEAASALLRFPGAPGGQGERLAAFTCSFGAADVSSYRVTGTTGDLRVEPAYDYAGELVHHLTRKGRTRVRRFEQRDQFAPELVHFSDCVRSGEEPSPSGAEGLADVRIIEALYRSAESGRAERLDVEPPARRPELADELRRPPVQRPELVHAQSPGGGR